MSEFHDDLLWRHLQTLPAFRGLLRAVEARFYHQFDLPGPVLDLGCGDGNFAELTFNEAGRQIDVGVDPWWNPLVKSRRREIYPGAVQALGDRMPFPDGYFGSAISNSVLEHIPDLQPVLNETGRVLELGGRFLMTMPNHQFTASLGGAQIAEKYGLHGLAGRYRRFFNFIARHAHTEGIDWWAERLATAGFTIERWQYYFSPQALHALEIGHVQGLPAAVTHALTGQWVLVPTPGNLGWVDRWLRPFYLEQGDRHGTCLFICARKTADHPVAVHVPAPQPFQVDPVGNLVPESSAAPAATVLEPGPAPGSRPVVDAGRPAPAAPSLPAERPARRPLRAQLVAYRLPIGLLGLGFLLTLLATPAAGAGRPLLGLILWLAGSGTAAAGLLYQASLRPGWRPAALVSSWPVLATAGALFFIALILRAANLDRIPFVLSGTEANIGLDAWRLVNGEWGSPFGTGVLTNPLLPFYLLGLPLELFGRTTLAIRLWSPLIGAATVAATYLLGRRLWSAEVGLAAAVFLAGSHVHIHYSRLGLTNIWDPLLALLGLGLLLLAWRERRPLFWVAAGLIWGISAYFFTIGHLLPLLLPPLLLVWLIADRPGARANGRWLLAALALALVVALPLLRHYQSNPQIFWERYNQYGIGPTGWLADEAARTGQSPNALLVSQIWQSAAAFTGAADTSLYYGAERGLLGLGGGLLFLAGLAYALWHIRRPSSQMLLVWLLVTIIFGGILLLQPPASHRLLLALPAATLLTGLALAAGLTSLRQKLLPAAERARLTGGWHLALIVLLAGLLVSSETLFYFQDYQPAARFADPNTETAHEIGRWLQQQAPAEAVVYLFTAPRLFADFPNIAFLAPDFRYRQNLFDGISPTELPALEPGRPAAFVFVPERLSELAVIKDSFPGGRETTIEGRYADPLVIIYQVDP